MPNAGAAEAQFSELQQRVTVLEKERDEYKHQYVVLLEAYRKVEAGLLGQKRERYLAAEGQLALGLLSMLVQEQAAPKAETQPVEAHERRKPTGRKPLPETLPRVEVEVTPPEVQRRGLDAYERIGEEVSETVERRPASVVVAADGAAQVRSQGGGPR